MGKAGEGWGVLERGLEAMKKGEERLRVLERGEKRLRGMENSGEG